MKKYFKLKLLSILLVLVMVLAFVPVSALTAFAAERDREIVAVDSGNSFNMRLSAGGVLTWDEVAGATGYKVALLNSMGQSIWEWDNTLTNSRVLQFISEMDNSKYDSGRYTIEVIAKDANKKASMSYYYTSNVDKLEEPHGLQWLGNQAVWEYVDGAIQYELFLYNFDGLAASKSVTQCPVDLSEYNPQDGWTFAVRAETNGALKDKRNSNIAESPKKGNGTRTVNLVDSGNALNMRITENEILMWDEVIGATGYQVVLKNPIGVEIYRWDNDFTNNNRMLPIITEMDNLKIDSGDYRFEVEPKGAGSVAVIANYYYTSSVEQFEAPYNLKWNGSTATWTAVNGASSYDVTLYDFNGQVKTVTVTDDWYDFSEYNPQDGWTFKVQADGDGKSTAKRSSNATESPAKTTSYNLTVVAYGTGNLTNTGKVSMETENGTQDFSTSVGGTFIKNTEVTVKAEANPGYEFVAWRVTTPENPEATLSTNATHTFNLTSNLQLFAVFREIPSEYSVAYHGNGATGGMTGDTVATGGTYTLKECSYNTPYGKKFVGWAIGGADVTPLKQPGEEITINADTTIYAVWENLYFTTQPTNTSGKIGKNVILPVEIDLSQVHNDDGYNIVLEVKNGENWEKVAEAKRSEWNLLNGGFTVQQNSACTKEYRYKIYNGTEWITSDTFTVEFLPIIVTFVDNDHSTTTEPIEVNTVGDKITQPDEPTYSGDTFYGWGWPYWDFENQTVTQDTTLSAQWAGRGYYGNIPNAYAKPGEKARIDLSNVYNNGSYVYIYKYDGAEWKQDVAVSGYTWYDVPASNVEKIERYKIVISHSQNIESNEFTVTWTNDLPTYFVSYGVGEGQGSGGADYDIEHGTNYTLDSYEDFGTIIAPNGKVFDYWSIRVGENAMDSIEIAQKKAGETITVTANTFAIAMWKNAPTVTVSYYSIGNIVDSDTIAVGTQHTLMDAQVLDVPSGKKFKAWAIGGLGGEQKQPGDEITITEETYIYAVWEEIPHECVGVIESGQGATCTVDGWKDYYRCECGKYYEDANCQTPISDLEAWKIGDGKITASHSGTPEWIKTATTHAKKYTCCETFVIETEAHEWNNGTCSECEYVCLHTADTNKDHKCDACGSTVGTHEAALGKHTCDYCEKTVTECTDNDKDHECDICKASVGEHVDADHDHICDKYGENCALGSIGQHEAESGKHNCAYCDKPVSECNDANTDHKCDICGTVMTPCKDENSDGSCDICDAVLATTPAETTDASTPAQTTPVETPVATTPVETPVATTPVETPVATTPVETPVATTPVETPVATTPVETPVATTPVETPVATTPVETPVATTPVETPVATTPVETPVATTPVETPVATTPVETPVATTPVETPVATTPVETPVATTPVETPVATTPVETPVATTPVETPVATTPVETPVVTTPVETPVATTPVETPVVTTPVETPVVTTPVETPPAVTTPTDPDVPGDEGLPAGAVVAIVIGSTVVVGGGGFALFWFVIKKKSIAELLMIFKKK